MVIGHESFTSMAIPQAFDLRELKYILWGVAFLISFSVSIEVLVSSRRKGFEWDLLMLLRNILVFFLSPREQTFQEVSFLSSSGDFKVEGASSIILVACG